MVKVDICQINTSLVTDRVRRPCITALQNYVQKLLCVLTGNYPGKKVHLCTFVCFRDAVSRVTSGEEKLIAQTVKDAKIINIDI